MNIEPERLVLTNMDTGESLPVQFNPSELQEVFEAVYGRLTIPGLAHQPLQFSHSKNDVMTFELFLTGRRAEGSDALLGPAITNARRKLKAWTSPRSVSDDIVGGSPPTILVTWPRTLSFEGKITRATVITKRWAAAGVDRGPTRAVATVTIEEVRDFQVTSDEIEFDNNRWGFTEAVLLGDEQRLVNTANVASQLNLVDS